MVIGNLSGNPTPEDNVSDSAIRMPGQAQMQIALLRSFDDHFARVEAVDKAMLDTIKELAAITQRAAMFAASPAERTEAMTQQGIVANEFGHDVRLSPAPVPQVPHVRQPSAPARPEGFEGVTDTGPSVKPNFNAPKSYAQGRKMGFGGARAAVFDRAAQAVQNATGGGEYFAPTEITFNPILGRYFDAEGYDVSDDIGQRARFGGEQFFRNSVTGEVVEQGTAERGMQVAARGAAVRTAINTFGGGGTLGESVAAGLPKVGRALGMAGLAAGTVMQGQNFIEGQTARNLEYQRVLGGGNFQGYGERLRGKVFDFEAGFNPFNPADTDAIYRNALNLYSGDDAMRGQYQREAVGLARSTGMNASEVDRVFRMAKENGITALGEIAQSLEDVTRAAKEAGTNAIEARNRYTEALGSYGALIDGSSANVLAQAQASYITSSFGAVAAEIGVGSNQSSITNLLASRNGMTANQYRAVMENDPSRYLQDQGQLNVQMAMRMLGAAGQAIVGRFMEENGLKTGDQIDEPMIEALVNELRQDPNVPDERLVARNLARFTNMTVPEDKGFFTIVGIIFSGENSLSSEYEAGQESLRQGSAADRMDLREFTSASDGFFEAPRSLEWMLPGTGRAEGLRNLGTEYQRFSNANNVSDPLIERLMNRAKDDESFAEESRFTVETADGPRTVDIQDLFKNYLDQVSAGTVTVATEGNESIAEVFGMDSSRGSAVAVTSTSSSGRGEDRSGEVTGRIQIDMAPELREFFTIRATNGLQVNTGTYSGTTVPSPDARPTGG